MLKAIACLLFGGEEQPPDDFKSGEMSEEEWQVVSHQEVSSAENQGPRAGSRATVRLSSTPGSKHASPRCEQSSRSRTCRSKRRRPSSGCTAEASDSAGTAQPHSEGTDLGRAAPRDSPQHAAPQPRPPGNPAEPFPPPAAGTSQPGSLRLKHTHTLAGGEALTSTDSLVLNMLHIPRSGSHQSTCNHTKGSYLKISTAYPIRSLP
ncbi:unnamed protein product [Tetraodon nigroviridis]|uniref:(spotted green pufferfish) hypothetical protein n=1 Tax=Tetraodon nigroviridis TaxID=99883 RepID=Q4TCP3_TETNG|nr:unnamed protein product [Tetraodon nigroviridis]